jgi:hypothetical protein
MCRPFIFDYVQEFTHAMIAYQERQLVPLNEVLIQIQGLCDGSLQLNKVDGMIVGVAWFRLEAPRGGSELALVLENLDAVAQIRIGLNVLNCSPAYIGGTLEISNNKKAINTAVGKIIRLSRLAVA